MNQFEKQLHTVSKEIRLSDTERINMREKLEQYMEFTPARAKVSETTELSVGSEIFRLLQTFGRRYAPAALGLVFIAASTGVSFAAEKAVPGEPLYSVKVNFNEEVVGALSFSEEAKTDWEVRRAERRLEEAGRLASRGVFTDDLREQVTEQFTLHAARVAEKAKSIGGVNPAYAAEVSNEFESALDAHEAILVSLAVEGENNREVASSLAATVRNTAKEVALIREAAEEVVAVNLYVEDVAVASTSKDEVTPESTEQQRALAKGMRVAAEESLNNIERSLRRERVVHADLDISNLKTGNNLLEMGLSEDPFHLLN